MNVNQNILKNIYKCIKICKNGGIINYATNFYQIFYNTTNYLLGVDILAVKLLKRSIVKYFILSCIASLIDFLIAYICYRWLKLNYMLSCNFGIASGLVFHYFTSMKYVFDSDGNGKFFFIYMATFFLGLALANGTMWICYDLESLPFIISKMASMGVPFFATYFIRKKLLGVKVH